MPNISNEVLKLEKIFKVKALNILIPSHDIINQCHNTILLKLITFSQYESMRNKISISGNKKDTKIINRNRNLDEFTTFSK